MDDFLLSFRGSRIEFMFMIRGKEERRERGWGMFVSFVFLNL